MAGQFNIFTDDQGGGGGGSTPTLVSVTPSTDYEVIDVTAAITAADDGATLIFYNTTGTKPAILQLTAGYIWNGGNPDAGYQLLPFSSKGVMSVVVDKTTFAPLVVSNITGNNTPSSNDVCEQLDADLIAGAATVTMQGTRAKVRVKDSINNPVVGTEVYVTVESAIVTEDTPINLVWFDNQANDSDFLVTAEIKIFTVTPYTSAVIVVTPSKVGAGPPTWTDALCGFYITIG